MFDQIYLEAQRVERRAPSMNRRVPFVGAKNFRDLGGYQATDHRTIRWGRLYRSDCLHKLTDSDLKRLTSLSLEKIVDFRADHEIAEEPDRLPVGAEIRVVRIPILDNSTEVWRDSREQFPKDNLREINPVYAMIETNIELATWFTPQLQLFVQEVLAANGRPLLFHCAAGKDRTGFAAAILLRILGVPQEVVMQDYLLSNQFYLSAHRWDLTLLQLTRGKRFASIVKGFLEVRSAYLATAFEAINYKYGSFKYYVHNGLGLALNDMEHLKMIYLE